MFKRAKNRQFHIIILLPEINCISLAFTFSCLKFQPHIVLLNHLCCTWMIAETILKKTGLSLKGMNAPATASLAYYGKIFK